MKKIKKWNQQYSFNYSESSKSLI